MYTLVLHIYSKVSHMLVLEWICRQPWPTSWLHIWLYRKCWWGSSYLGQRSSLDRQPLLFAGWKPTWL